MFRKYWRVMLIVAGVAVFAAGVAQAQANPSTAPSHETWFQILLGIVIMLLGAYAKGLEKRLSVTEGAVAQQQRQIDREYHTKAETNEHFDEIKAAIGALHRRLDYMRVPHVPNQPTDYG